MQRLTSKAIGFAIAVVSVSGLAAASELVSVAGSSARFATSVEVQVGGKPVPMTLTGATLRKRAIINIYAIGSYLQTGVTVKSADELAASDSIKMLVLILERDVKGRDMAEGIQSGVRLNHPANAFPAELGKIVKTLGTMDLRKGDQVMLTAIPRVGLRCQVVGKGEVTIESPAFARAVWDIYLGRQNLGEPIKAALTSRL
jgi:hypothetical protein